MKRSMCLIAIVFMGTGSGCLIGGEDVQSVSFRLSLTDLGLEDAAPAVGRWLEWLDDPGPGNPAFDMGAAGDGFFLALDLTGTSPTGLLDFTIENDRQEVLVSDSEVEINLLVSACADCVFSALVYWEDQEAQPPLQRLNTFSGSSLAFDVVPGEAVDPVDLDVYLEATGSIRCRVQPNGYQGLVTVAAYDVAEHVILPPAQGQTYGETIDLLIPDIPVGREMNVLVRREGEQSYNTEPVNPQWRALVVGSPGEEVLVEFSL